MALNESITTRGFGVASKIPTRGFAGGATATVSAASTKRSSLHAIQAANTGSYNAFINFFDVAAGSVTPGVTAPKKTLMVPAGQPLSIVWAAPVAFDTAMSYVVTTGTDNPQPPATALNIYLDIKE